MSDKLLEALSDTQHGIWAHWMTYLFSVCHTNDDGSVTIPADSVKRWKRQCETDYADLTEKEKVSDRNQARKVIATWIANAPTTTDHEKEQ